MFVLQRKSLTYKYRRPFAGLMTVLVLLAITGLAVAYGKKWVLAKSGLANSPPLMSEQTKPSKQLIPSELIVLQPNGFEPAILTRPRGKFLLAMDNRTGLRDLSFELTRGDGTRERQKDLSGHRVRWREVMDLTPGDYILKVAGHPDWLCRITITAN